MQNVIYFPNMTSTLRVTGFQIGKYPSGWEYPRHHHQLFELLCCVGGEVYQEINRTTITLRSGDWLLINAQERHMTSNLSELEYDFFNVHFDLDDLDIRSLLSTASFRLITAAEAERSGKLNRYIEEIRQLSSWIPGEGAIVGGSQLEDKLLLQANILLIIHEILSIIRQQIEVKVETRNITPFAADTAHAIEERLSRGLHENISITIIAKELNMSRSQCTKLFTKVYGMSPQQYVSMKKLMWAKEMLITSNLPVSEIADRLGFQSASHFSRQFRRWTGYSPTSFKPKPQGERAGNRNFPIVNSPNSSPVQHST